MANMNSCCILVMEEIFFPFLELVLTLAPSYKNLIVYYAYGRRLSNNCNFSICRQHSKKGERETVFPVPPFPSWSLYWCCQTFIQIVSITSAIWECSLSSPSLPFPSWSLHSVMSSLHTPVPGSGREKSCWSNLIGLWALERRPRH